jgi:hypothetical protein
MSVDRARTIHPFVIGKHIAIGVTDITGAEVNGKLRRFKYTIARLGFQFKSQEKNYEYKTRLLQSPLHFPLSY